jgi:ankyrin repeat protein
MPGIDLEQLRKQAKERVRACRAAGEDTRLADAQRELALAHGFASWARLKAHVERSAAQQPFRTDAGYYEERAQGIASTGGVDLATARVDLARRHGFDTWRRLMRHVGEIREGRAPPPPFARAFAAIEAGDEAALRAELDRQPDLVAARGTNGNDLLGLAGDNLPLVRLLLARGADPNRGNDYGWTSLHQAGYGNRIELARVMLDAGAVDGTSARGDGGTPVVVALFWGHREVVELLAPVPDNLRVAGGLGRVDRIRALARTPAAGAHRAFYRPHGGFPAWRPSDDPQEVLDEALTYAARSGRVDAIRALVEAGARVDADPYRGTALTWAAVNGRVDAIRALVELGADVDALGTFGGPDHGEGVTALHLAAQAGRDASVEALLELGADPRLRDRLHDGPAAGWASFGAHRTLAERLQCAADAAGQRRTQR